MDQNVRDELEELRSLAARLAAIIGDTQATIASNQRDFENVSREIDGLMAKQGTRATDNQDDVLSAIGLIARRIEEKTATLAGELGSLRDRVSEVENHAERWRERALTDPLTRLPNRRSADAALARIVNGRAGAAGRPGALALADIDHFKSVNDTHGHAVGDAVLKFVALTLRKHLRPEDFVGRWGGEEFVLIFAETDIGTAQTICERLRQEVESRRFTLRDSGKPIGRITISIGLTALKANDRPDTALERADKALYAAKASGRNALRLELH